MNLRTFCISSDLDYQEYEIHQNGIEKIYEFTNPGRKRIIAIPDSCVDIQFVWKENVCVPYVCGSFLEGKESPVEEYDRCFGVKFSSGQIPEFCSNHISRLPEQRQRLDLFTDTDWVKNKFLQAVSFWDRVEIFMKKVREMDFCGMEYIIEDIMEEVETKNGCVHIGEIADKLGYSHRHMDRMFKNRMGISVKKYAGIIRMQQAIDILDNVESGKTDEIYETLGYFDQAHFIHDFKKYTSCTPKQYQKSAQLSIV